MNCKNCNEPLDLQINYCSVCGAKNIRNRLTMKNIASDINEQFLNIDNKFLKTFIHLLTKPEVVINGFIDGTRKKYVNVIQYFAISLTIVGIQVFIMNTFFKEAMELDPNMFGPIANPENQEHNPLKDLKYEDYNNYQSLIYVFSIPFSAISTYLAYLIIGERRFNFTEHIVLNLYYSAEVIIINAIILTALLALGVDFMLLSLLTTLFIFIYFFFVLKRVFNATFMETLASFLLIMMAFIIMFFVITILVFIIGYLIGYYSTAGT